MDWRTWMYEKLTSDGPFSALVPAEDVHGAGSLELTPQRKPFVLIKLMPKVTSLRDGNTTAAHAQRAEVWAHGEPGSYLVLDAILSAATTALCGPASGDGICAEFEGDSGDLADEGWGTITKSASFRLVGAGA